MLVIKQIMRSFS